MANYTDVSFSSSIEPMMLPVSCEVTDTLEVMCACLSSLFANESKEMSWRVTNTMVKKRMIAML